MSASVAETEADDRVVVLVSADWAGPSRPAPTVLRELGRRWGEGRRTLLIEDPDDAVLDQLQVNVLPTWLLCAPGEGPQTIPELSGTTGSGEDVVWEGPWRAVRRRDGALPKHAVDAEFGPGAA